MEKTRREEKEEGDIIVVVAQGFFLYFFKSLLYMLLALLVRAISIVISFFSLYSMASTCLGGDRCGGDFRCGRLISELGLVSVVREYKTALISCILEHHHRMLTPNQLY